MTRPALFLAKVVPFGQLEIQQSQSLSCWVEVIDEFELEVPPAAQIQKAEQMRPVQIDLLSECT